MSDPNHTLIPECRCPQCGHLFDRVSACDDGPFIPTPGDISMCIECGCPLISDAEMRQRKMTLEEQKQIKIEYPETWERFVKIQNTLNELHNTRCKEEQ